VRRPTRAQARDHHAVKRRQQGTRDARGLSPELLSIGLVEQGHAPGTSGHVLHAALFVCEDPGEGGARHQFAGAQAAQANKQPRPVNRLLTERLPKTGETGDDDHHVDAIRDDRLVRGRRFERVLT